MDFFKLEDNTYKGASEADATHVMIPIKEYHGLKVAKEINDRKALQQLNKALVDENGYMLVSAHKRKFESNIWAWHITKQTNISSKVSEVASVWNSITDAIEMDLMWNYNYIEDDEIEFTDTLYSGEFKRRKTKINLSKVNEIYDLKKAGKVDAYEDAAARFNGSTFDYYNGNLPKESEKLAIWEKLESMNWTYSWGLDDVSLNFKEGCVVVSYWANEIF